MQNNYTTKGKHLTIHDRRNIERWLGDGKSHREIARLLGKARFKKVYSADFAQANYEKNRKRSVKKLILTKELKEKILHYHKQKYSPEMMVKAKNIEAGVSTIYYWINEEKHALSRKKESC